MLAIEANDEWLVGRGYIARHSMGSLLQERPHPQDSEEVLELQTASAATDITDEKSANLLHHIPGLDLQAAQLEGNGDEADARLPTSTGNERVVVARIGQTVES